MSNDAKPWRRFDIDGGRTVKMPSGDYTDYAEAKATVDTLAARIAELEAQLEAAEKRKAKDAALLSGFVDALEEIAGSSSLTATPKQFAVHLQRIAKNSLLAAADALGEK